MTLQEIEYKYLVKNEDKMVLGRNHVTVGSDRFYIIKKNHKYTNRKKEFSFIIQLFPFADIDWKTINFVTLCA